MGGDQPRVWWLLTREWLCRSWPTLQLIPCGPRSSEAQPHPPAFSVLLDGGTFEGVVSRALKACWVVCHTWGPLSFICFQPARQMGLVRP